MLVLLLQLNADLPDTFAGHERRLWVFSCRRKACRRKEGSVRALRGVRIAKQKEKKEKEKEMVDVDVQQEKKRENIGESLFGVKSSSVGGSANPFSSGGGGRGGGANPFANPFSTNTAAQGNPFAAAGLPTSALASKPPQQPTSPSSELPKTFASALSLNNDQASSNSKSFGPAAPPEPWPPAPDLPKAYPQYYLEDDTEYLDKIPLPDQAVITQTMDIDEPNGSSSGGGGKEDKEVFESSIDKTFQKFADRLSQNPEQVIRYEFKGQPLLYSKTDAVGKSLSHGSGGDTKVKVSGGGQVMGACGNCGSRRVFEVQLTPYAIMELEKEEEGFDGMEWGTIIVGVCEKDCGSEGEVVYSEEWVGVQWEELKK